MPKTCVQTVEVFVPGMDLMHYTMEEYPVRPAWATDTTHVQAQKAADRIIIWFTTGVCEVFLEDGTMKRFWPKPTRADAVNAPAEGHYFRFHADGAVEQTYKCANFYWSSDMEGKPLGGDWNLVPTVWWCDAEGPCGFFHAFGECVKFPVESCWAFEERACACRYGLYCRARRNWLIEHCGMTGPSCGDCDDCRECLGDYDTDYESDH